MSNNDKHDVTSQNQVHSSFVSYGKLMNDENKAFYEGGGGG